VIGSAAANVCPSSGLFANDWGQAPIDMPVATATATEHRATPTSVADLVDRQLVCSAYQPLIDLYSGETIGYEALARGPKGSRLERPDALFEAAQVAGLEREVEWECQRAALRGALAAGLGAGQSLFVNLEPRLLRAERPAALAELLSEALGRFDVIAEFTERSLTDRPAELLAAVERLRQRGVGIALDDVGSDPRSLALMPFLAPDVIKLDLRLVQENPTRRVAEIVHAVSAEAERTGALVLAEGIETEQHRQTALALGARYGQGWMFGRPDELHPSGTRQKRALSTASRARQLDRVSPFETVAAHRSVRRGNKRLLLALSLQIEAQARGLGASAVVLSTFQQAPFFTARTAARYSAMAEHAALVGALGVGLSAQPAEGVRGIALDQGDPLRGEWDVTVIAPHFAMAFVARELDDGSGVADMERSFDFAMTYDRELAVAAARAMMNRVAPA
jgi:EAL domain-containing protein (putative c-di-GMP-specific phosphodiesterase class I)/DICT domain-containing protein